MLVTCPVWAGGRRQTRWLTTQAGQPPRSPRVVGFRPTGRSQNLVVLAPSAVGDSSAGVETGLASGRLCSMNTLPLHPNLHERGDLKVCSMWLTDDTRILEAVHAFDGLLGITRSDGCSSPASGRPGVA